MSGLMFSTFYLKLGSQYSAYNILTHLCVCMCVCMWCVCM